MKTILNKAVGIILLPVLLFLFSGNVFGQKVGFISSDIIREKFPEAAQADQRIKSMVDEWKRELEDLEKQIDKQENDIKQNRLIWSDEERSRKTTDLENLKTQKLEYARKKFETGGEYDITVKLIMTPIEDKIYAAIQEVASDEGYDFIWDKNTNPLPYSNYKYDMTVKVLKKLGVDVQKLEEELKAKIEKDPRNKKTESKGAPRGKSRDKTQGTDKTIEDIPSGNQPNTPMPGGKDIKTPADTIGKQPK